MKSCESGLDSDSLDCRTIMYLVYVAYTVYVAYAGCRGWAV